MSSFTEFILFLQKSGTRSPFYPKVKQTPNRLLLEITISRKKEPVLAQDLLFCHKDPNIVPSKSDLILF
jgi:hypothetical protein